MRFILGLLIGLIVGAKNSLIFLEAYQTAFSWLTHYLQNQPLPPT